MMESNRVLDDFWPLLDSSEYHYEDKTNLIQATENLRGWLMEIYPTENVCFDLVKNLFNFYVKQQTSRSFKDFKRELEPKSHELNKFEFYMCSVVAETFTFTCPFKVVAPDLKDIADIHLDLQEGEDYESLDNFSKMMCIVVQCFQSNIQTMKGLCLAVATYLAEGPNAKRYTTGGFANLHTRRREMLFEYWASKLAGYRPRSPPTPSSAVKSGDRPPDANPSSTKKCRKGERRADDENKENVSTQQPPGPPQGRAVITTGVSLFQSVMQQSGSQATPDVPRQNSRQSQRSSQQQERYGSLPGSRYVMPGSRLVDEYSNPGVPIRCATRQNSNSSTQSESTCDSSWDSASSHTQSSSCTSVASESTGYTTGSAVYAGRPPSRLSLQPAMTSGRLSSSSSGPMETPYESPRETPREPQHQYPQESLARLESQSVFASHCKDHTQRRDDVILRVTQTMAKCNTLRKSIESDRASPEHVARQLFPADRIEIEPAAQAAEADEDAASVTTEEALATALDLLDDDVREKDTDSDEMPNKRFSIHFSSSSNI